MPRTSMTETPQDRLVKELGATYLADAIVRMPLLLGALLLSLFEIRISRDALVRLQCQKENIGSADRPLVMHIFLIASCSPRHATRGMPHIIHAPLPSSNGPTHEPPQGRWMCWAVPPSCWKTSVTVFQIWCRAPVPPSFLTIFFLEIRICRS